MATSTPRMVLVQREKDLEKLTEGDEVKVEVTHGDPKWMMYVGKIPIPLRAETTCSFVEIPQRAEFPATKLYVWESAVEYLQFSRDGIAFNSLHREHRQIEQGTQEYGRLLPLVEKLVR